jgi:hypothetical protein
MVLLFDLPVDLVVPILRDWIDIFSLGKLDSASCSHSERVQYSKITRSKLFVCEDVHSEDFNDETNILHMKWFAKRGIRTFLWVINCDVAPAVVVNLVAETGGDHVHTLELYGLKEETAGIFAIVFHDCRSIVNVVVDNCSHWTGLRAACGDAQNSLRKLVVNGCGTEASATFHENHFPGLTCLYLDGGYGTSVITSLLAATPNLVDLRLRESLVDDGSLNILRNHANSLQTLVMFHCPLVSSAGVAALAEKCVNLTCLDLSSCPEVSDAAVQSLAAGCRSLETVRLCGSFTETAVSALAMLCGNSLRHLSFTSTSMVSDSGLRAVTAHCKGLVTLALEDCSGVTAAALVRLVSSVRSLRELALQSCPTVTDGVLKALCSHIPALRKLSLLASSGYTISGAHELIRSLRQLRLSIVEAQHSIFVPLVVRMWHDCRSKLMTYPYPSVLSAFEGLRTW